MESLKQLLTELKGTIASPWRSFASLPARLLLWLQLRQLVTALDSLFTAWREGSLPPLSQPATPAVPARAAASAPVAKSAAHSAPRQRRAPRARRDSTRPAQPRRAQRPSIAAPPQDPRISRSIAPRGHGRAPRHLTHHRR